MKQNNGKAKPDNKFKGKFRKQLLSACFLLLVCITGITAAARGRTEEKTGEKTEEISAEKSKKKSEENTEEKVKEISKEISDKKTIEDVVKNQKERIPGCGLADMAYSYDGGKNWTPDSFLEVAENGTYEVKVRDRLGNISSGSFRVEKIDRTAPAVEAVVRPEGFVKDKAVIILLASDDGSGLAGRPYSYDGGRTWTADSMHEVEENGNYQAAVRDAAGNITRLTVPVENIDRDPPEISFTLTPEPWQGGSAVLTVHAVDRGCGLDAKAFSFDNGRSFQTSGRKVIQEPGEIKVLVRDALGNFAHGYCRAVPLRKLEWTPPE